MAAYAFAQLKTVDLNAEIAGYLRRIDDTLPEYCGRFLVHGVVPEVVDGEFEGSLVVIEFPDVERAKAWYSSPGYQEIVDFRVHNSVGGAAVVDGVPEGYRAATFAAKVGL